MRQSAHAHELAGCGADGVRRLRRRRDSGLGRDQQRVIGWRNDIGSERDHERRCVDRGIRGWARAGNWGLGRRRDRGSGRWNVCLRRRARVPARRRGLYRQRVGDPAAGWPGVRALPVRASSGGLSASSELHLPAPRMRMRRVPGGGSHQDLLRRVIPGRRRVPSSPGGTRQVPADTMDAVAGTPDRLAGAAVRATRAPLRLAGAPDRHAGAPARAPGRRDRLAGPRARAPGAHDRFA